jgi:antitoxin MazE
MGEKISLPTYCCGTGYCPAGNFLDFSRFYKLDNKFYLCIFAVDTERRYGMFREASMHAVTRFSTWGHSLAVRIPASLAREARIVEGGAAELSIVNGQLVIAPIDTPPNYNINELIAAITDENRHVEIGTGHAQGGEFA